jgi:hypothetical protein
MKVEKSHPTTPVVQINKTVHFGTKNGVSLAPATSDQALAKFGFGRLYHFTIEEILNSARLEDLSLARISAKLRAPLETLYKVHHWPNCRNAIQWQRWPGWVK